MIGEKVADMIKEDHKPKKIEVLKAEPIPQENLDKQDNVTEPVQKSDEHNIFTLVEQNVKLLASTYQMYFHKLMNIFGRRSQDN